MSAADSPSRCLCVLNPFAENRTQLSATGAAGTVVFFATFLSRRDTCCSSVATRRFNAAMSDRYCADDFFSFSVSLRTSLRATLAISSFRTDAMFGNFVLPWSSSKGFYYTQTAATATGLCLIKKSLFACLESDSR
ncbi:MAG: hypothetical protein WC100_20965 [Sterolibacterium sp.]